MSVAQQTRIVRVLEADPDLAAGIEGDQLPLVMARAVAPLLLYPDRGPWSMDEEEIDSTGHLGLLVLDGILARRVEVGGRAGVELLGPGDVLRPWVRSEFAQPDVNWAVIESLQIASLDRQFAERVAVWPQIAGAISDRLLLRARALAFHLAVCHLVTVEDRLRTILWHFAERWGRVTRDGVIVRLPLTHELLAGVVGARRPPVSTALGALADKGLVRRRDDGAWILSGPPPEAFKDLHRQLGSPIEPAS